MNSGILLESIPKFAQFPVRLPWYPSWAGTTRHANWPIPRSSCRACLHDTKSAPNDLGTKTSQQRLTFVHSSSILPKTRPHKVSSHTFSSSQIFTNIRAHDWLEWFDCVMPDTSWHIVSAVSVSPGNFQPNAKPYRLPQG